jgi:hypothetical protein
MADGFYSLARLTGKVYPGCRARRGPCAATAGEKQQIGLERPHPATRCTNPWALPLCGPAPA